MGHARKRPGRDGKPRYTAYYEDLPGVGTLPARSGLGVQLTGRGN